MLYKDNYIFYINKYFEQIRYHFSLIAHQKNNSLNVKK